MKQGSQGLFFFFSPIEDEVVDVEKRQVPQEVNLTIRRSVGSLLISVRADEYPFFNPSHLGFFQISLFSGGHFDIQ